MAKEVITLKLEVMKPNMVLGGVSFFKPEAMYLRGDSQEVERIAWDLVKGKSYRASLCDSDFNESEEVSIEEPELPPLMQDVRTAGMVAELGDESEPAHALISDRPTAATLPTFRTPTQEELEEASPTDGPELEDDVDEIAELLPDKPTHVGVTTRRLDRVDYFEDVHQESSNVSEDIPHLEGIDDPGYLDAIDMEYGDFGRQQPDTTRAKNQRRGPRGSTPTDLEF